MPSNGKVYGFLLATLVAAAPAARAQSRTQSRSRAAAAPAASAGNPVELGIDGGISFGLNDPKTTTIMLPAQQFRAGFMLDDKMELEPFGAFNYFSVSGGGSSTALGLGTGLLYHLSTVRTQPQVYVRPLAMLQFLSVNPGGAAPSSSTTQFGLGIGLGVKRPILDRLSWRFEGNLGHSFQSGNAPSQTSINLLAGLSFFTR